MITTNSLAFAVSLVTGCVTCAAELASTPVDCVTEVTFAGPRQTAKDSPARDVQLSATFRHESGSPQITVQGFFDGDGFCGVHQVACERENDDSHKCYQHIIVAFGDGEDFE